MNETAVRVSSKKKQKKKNENFIVIIVIIIAVGIGRSSILGENVVADRIGVTYDRRSTSVTIIV